MQPVTVDAVLVKAGDRAIEIFKERLAAREVKEGIRFIAAKGVVVVGEEAFTVNTGQHISDSESRTLRRLLAGMSGRQFKKYRKRLRRFKKSKAIKSLIAEQETPQ